MVIENSLFYMRKKINLSLQEIYDALHNHVELFTCFVDDKQFIKKC